MLVVRQRAAAALLLLLFIGRSDDWGQSSLRSRRMVYRPKGVGHTRKGRDDSPNPRKRNRAKSD